MRPLPRNLRLRSRAREGVRGLVQSIAFKIADCHFLKPAPVLLVSLMMRFLSCLSMLVVALSSCTAPRYARLTVGGSLIKSVEEVCGSRVSAGSFTPQTIGHPVLKSRKATPDDIAKFWSEIEALSVEDWRDSYVVENDDADRHTVFNPYSDWKLEIRSPKLNVVKMGGGYYPGDHDPKTLSPHTTERFIRLGLIFDAICRTPENE